MRVCSLQSSLVFRSSQFTNGQLGVEESGRCRVRFARDVRRENAREGPLESPALQWDVL